MNATIFGLASAAGRAGVSVFRVSGPQCDAAWSVLTRGRPLPRQRVATVARLYGRHDDLLDQCLALRFPAPASFSGEDVLELHVHGSHAVQEGVAEALGGVPGVRMAHAGEFTRRAFENKKLALTEVEALSDLIQAETRAQRVQALRQLSGELGRLYEDWRKELIGMLARVEAVIDFADDERIEEETYDKVRPQARRLAEAVRGHLDDGRRGERVRTGAKVAVVGPPNSGKSSLYNALLQRNAAIVTDVPGTTRDVLEAPLEVGGHLVSLVDTAGLRETSDAVEQQGIAKARLEYAAADVRLVLLDWRNAAAHIGEYAELRPMPSLVVLNKTDTAQRREEVLAAQEAVSRAVPSVPVVAISCLAKQLSPLLEQLSRELGPLAGGGAGAPALTRPRHRAHLEAACQRLEQFSQSYVRGAEVAAEDLRWAVREIAAISGHVTVDGDVLDVIFSEFCIGK